METVSKKQKMEGLRVKLGFDRMYEVDSVGRSGGLSLFWKEGTGMEIQKYSRRHINAIIKVSEMHKQWKFTGFYGNPDSSKRQESWELMKHLKQFSPQPWLCVGDFNEIIDQSKKEGAILRKEGEMEKFREALENCALCDLGFSG